MCCPCCTGELQTSIPAIGDQEPIMTCRACGVHLTSDVFGLFMDETIGRELVQELHQLLKA